MMSTFQHTKTNPPEQSIRYNMLRYQYNSKISPVSHVSRMVVMYITLYQLTISETIRHIRNTRRVTNLEAFS